MKYTTYYSPLHMYYERITTISLVHIHHLKINKQTNKKSITSFSSNCLSWWWEFLRSTLGNFQISKTVLSAIVIILGIFISRNYLITRRFSTNVSSFGFQLSDDFSSIISHNGVKVTSPGNMYVFKKQRQKKPHWPLPKYILDLFNLSFCGRNCENVF